MTILCTFYNATCWEFNAPAIKFFTALLWMFCVVASVRIRATRGIGAGVLALIIFLCGLHAFAVLIAGSNMMSSVWDMSLSFIRKFKNQAEKVKHRRRKHIRLNSVSFLPLRFTVGIFYYMDREAIVALTRFLTTGAADLLIASNADGRWH